MTPHYFKLSLFVGTLSFIFLFSSCNDEMEELNPEPGEKYFTQILDENFEKKLLEQGIDTDGTLNQQIFLEDAEAVTALNLSTVDTADNSHKILDLTGIEAFKNLTELSVENNRLTAISLQENTALEKLYLNFNQLKSIDLSENRALTFLSIARNELEEIDLSANVNLQSLSLEGNYLTSLDISKNTQLVELNAIVNELTAIIGLPQSTQLTSLNLAWNYLEELTVNLPNLQILNIEQNELNELKVNGCTSLRTLIARNNVLSELDLSSNAILETLLLSANDINEIDLRQNREIDVLWISHNRLSRLDVSLLSKLYDLSVFGNEGLSCIEIAENQAIATVRKEDGQYLNTDSCD